LVLITSIYFLLIEQGRSQVTGGATSHPVA